MDGWMNYLCAGGPSIIILIHKICIAFRGLGNPNITDKVISERAATLLNNRVDIYDIM